MIVCSNRYPPYTSTKLTLMRTPLRKFDFSFLGAAPWLLAFVAGILVTVIAQITKIFRF